MTPGMFGDRQSVVASNVVIEWAFRVTVGPNAPIAETPVWGDAVEFSDVPPPPDLDKSLMIRLLVKQFGETLMREMGVAGHLTEIIDGPV